MSKKEAPIGLTIMEKMLGLILIAVGALTFYATYTDIASAVNPAFFFVTGLALVVLGLLLFTAKTE